MARIVMPVAESHEVTVEAAANELYAADFDVMVIPGGHGPDDLDAFVSALLERL
jgi:putative intracellular protease/amidase